MSGPPHSRLQSPQRKLSRAPGCHSTPPRSTPIKVSVAAMKLYKNGERQALDDYQLKHDNLFFFWSILDLSHVFRGRADKKERKPAASVARFTASQPADCLDFLNELLLCFWNLRHHRQDVVETRYFRYSFQNTSLPW